MYRWAGSDSCHDRDETPNEIPLLRIVKSQSLAYEDFFSMILLQYDDTCVSLLVPLTISLGVKVGVDLSARDTGCLVFVEKELGPQ